MFRRLLAIVLTLSSVACVQGDGRRVPASIMRPSAAQLSLHPGGSLAFVSERDGHPQVFTITPGEPRVQQRTRVPGSAFIGPVGPNDEMLVVTSRGHDATAREQLHVLDGSELRPLSPETRFVRHPSWLPDGRVVFESDLRGFRNIFVTAARGSVVRLTDCTHGCFEPTASGSHIAYASPDTGDGEIYTLELESRSVRRLTWSPGTDKRPAFSPDGRQIAFISHRDGTPRVFVMGHDGSKPRPLRAVSEPKTIERDHVWSPDGRHLAFVAQRDGRAGLRVVRVSDGATLAAADGDWVDQTPAWAPSGEHLAFTSDREGSPDLFIMRADGSAVTRITSHAAADWLPRWRKLGS